MEHFMSARSQRRLLQNSANTKAGSNALNSQSAMKLKFPLGPARSQYMPTFTSRDEALATIKAEGGTPEYLMCAISDRKVVGTYAAFEANDILCSCPLCSALGAHPSVVQRLLTTIRWFSYQKRPGSLTLQAFSMPMRFATKRPRRPVAAAF
jgi:hypothetical protein